MRKPKRADRCYIGRGYDDALGDVLARQARTTPPLPSAEPVAFPMEWSDPDSYLTQWRIAYERLVVKHEAARNNPEERMRALERKDRAFVEMLRLVSTRTTRPRRAGQGKGCD